MLTRSIEGAHFRLQAPSSFKQRPALDVGEGPYKGREYAIFPPSSLPSLSSVYSSAPAERLKEKSFVGFPLLNPRREFRRPGATLKCADFYTTINVCFSNDHPPQTAGIRHDISSSSKCSLEDGCLLEQRLTCG